MSYQEKQAYSIGFIGKAITLGMGIILILIIFFSIWKPLHVFSDFPSIVVQSVMFAVITSFVYLISLDKKIEKKHWSFAIILGLLAVTYFALPFRFQLEKQIINMKIEGQRTEDKCVANTEKLKKWYQDKYLVLGKPTDTENTFKFDESCVTNAEDREFYESLFREGEKVYTNEEYRLAIRYYKDLQNKLDDGGDSFFSQDLFGKAHLYFLKSAVYLNLGFSYGSNNNPKEAIEAFSNSIDNSIKFKDKYESIKSKNPEEIKKLSHQMQGFEGYHMAYCNLGWLQTFENKNEEGKEKLKEAIVKWPYRPEPYYCLLNIYIRDNKLSQVSNEETIKEMEALKADFDKAFPNDKVFSNRIDIEIQRFKSI